MSGDPKVKPQQVKKQKSEEMTKSTDELQKPTVKVMVNDALTEMKSRKGVSLYAIKEYMTTKYKVDPVKLNFHIKRYIKNGVETGVIIQTKGTGASGSFKLVPTKEKKVKTVKKPSKEETTKINTSKEKTTKIKSKKESNKVKETKKVKTKEVTTETTKKNEEKKVKLVKRNKLLEKIKKNMATPNKGSPISKRKSIGSIIKKPKMKPRKLVN